MSSNVVKMFRSPSSMVPRKTADGSGRDARERIKESSRASSSRSIVPMNTAPPLRLAGSPLASASAAFFFGVRLRRRLFFFSGRGAPVPSASPPVAAGANAPRRRDVATTRFAVIETADARKGATGATPRALMPDAPRAGRLDASGTRPRGASAVAAVMASQCASGKIGTAEVAFLPPNSQKSLILFLCGSGTREIFLWGFSLFRPIIESLVRIRANIHARTMGPNTVCAFHFPTFPVPSFQRL